MIRGVCPAVCPSGPAGGTDAVWMSSMSKGASVPASVCGGWGCPRSSPKQKRGLPSLAVPVAQDLTGGGRAKGTAVPVQKQKDLFPDRI